jgi:protein SCO1/2
VKWKLSRLLIGGGLVCLLIAPASPAHAQEAPPPDVGDVGFDQRLGEPVPLDLAFRDEAGHPVQLGDYVDGKPVILTLNYFHCPNFCTLVLDGLAKSLEEADLKMGSDFTVVTVSIDPRETPELAAAQKDLLLRHYSGLGIEDNWHFLTGDAPAIERLTQAVGFRYAYDALQDEYAHPAGLVILTSDGKIARYLYGAGFLTRDLRLALVEASQNRIGTLTDQVLLRCYRYDPATGRYSLMALNIVRLGSLITTLAFGGFLLFLWRREIQQKGV